MLPLEVIHRQDLICECISPPLTAPVRIREGRQRLPSAKEVMDCPGRLLSRAVLISPGCSLPDCA